MRRITPIGWGLAAIVVVTTVGMVVLPRHAAGIAIGFAVFAGLVIAGEGVGAFSVFVGDEVNRKAEVARRRIGPRERVGDSPVYDEDAWARERAKREGPGGP